MTDVILMMINFLILMSILVGSGWTKDDEPMPTWKNLLIEHKSWGGYLESSTNRSMSSFRVLSTQREEGGTSLIEFKSEHVNVEMTVSSEDNRIVVFKEVTTWHKAAHMQGHLDLEFKGQFEWDVNFYKFVGNVSSSSAENFAEVTLIPEVLPVRKRNEKEKRGGKVGFYVGIPVALAIMVISLGALTMVWAYRKGYLRHVPLSYKAFGLPRKSKDNTDIGMEKTPPATPSTAAPSVHM